MGADRANSTRARSEKSRTQPRGCAYVGTDDLPSALERIRRAAHRDRRQRFTALWHHVYAVERLRAAYYSLRRQSAPGVDGQTWTAYGEALEANLSDLSCRLRRGAYRARPVRRAYIPKADGRQRPIGIPVLEDKIVQRAATAVLGAVYEEDFLGFTHICGKTRRGKFIVRRRPMRKRIRAKLRALKAKLRRRLHEPVRRVGRWLRTVLQGWYRYYAVPLTSHDLAAFRRALGRLWHRVLSRRSQRGRVSWEKMARLIARWLPPPRILHPYPWDRFDGCTQGRSPVR
jgi:hypothetical protein